MKNHLPPNSLIMPFPLRGRFLAQLVVPRDMTKEEADRLCAFVMSLATERTDADTLQAAD